MLLLHSIFFDTCIFCLLAFKRVMCSPFFTVEDLRSKIKTASVFLIESYHRLHWNELIEQPFKRENFSVIPYQGV